MNIFLLTKEELKTCKFYKIVMEKGIKKVQQHRKDQKNY